MSNKIYFPLLVLLVMLTGISNTFSQEVVKSKKEREEVLGRELGLNKEQSGKLVAAQEKYHEEVTGILRDTSVHAPQRSARLKALSQQYRSSLKLLLSPQQQEKMATSIRGRNQAKSAQFRQQLEARLPKGRTKGLAADSSKVKTRN